MFGALLGTRALCLTKKLQKIKIDKAFMVFNVLLFYIKKVPIA